MELLEELRREFSDRFPNDVLPSAIEDCLDDGNLAQEQMEKLRDDIENFRHKLRLKEYLLQFLETKSVKYERKPTILSPSMKEALEKFSDPDAELECSSPFFLGSDRGESTTEDNFEEFNPVVSPPSDSEAEDQFPTRYEKFKGFQRISKRSIDDEDDPESENKIYVNIQLKSLGSLASRPNRDAIYLEEGDNSIDSNKLKDRKAYLQGFLTDEIAYTKTLSQLMALKEKLEDVHRESKKSSKYVKTDDIDVIFKCIPEMYSTHDNFVEMLRNTLENYNRDSEISDIFKNMITTDIDIGQNYINNYSKASKCLEKLIEQIDKRKELRDIGTFMRYQLQEIASARKEEVKSSSKNDLRECIEPGQETYLTLLQKPITRVQKNLSIIPELIKLTPENHRDFARLKKITIEQQSFLKTYEPKVIEGEKVRHDLKNCVVAEQSGYRNRLRTLVLFNDCIACCRLIRREKENIQLMLKWFTPVLDIQELIPQEGNQSRMAELKRLRDKLTDTGNEMNKRRKYIDSCDNIISAYGNLNRENKDQHQQTSKFTQEKEMAIFDKLAKEARELTTKLTSLAPFLPLVIKSKNKKSHTVLFTSEFERGEWMKEIFAQKAKQEKITKSSDRRSSPSRVPDDDSKISSTDVQTSLNSMAWECLADPLDMFTDSTTTTLINGSGHIIIHRVNGLTDPINIKCAVEADSFGQRYIYSWTRLIPRTLKPSWEDEGFWVDFQGSEIMKIYVFQIDEGNDKIIGECSMLLSELYKDRIWQKKNFTINEKEVSIDVTINFQDMSTAHRRKNKNDDSAFFGVEIKDISAREHNLVPSIVQICAETVEEKGKNAEGIYRLSGLSQEVSKLKAYFEKDMYKAKKFCNEGDINTVCSVMKLFFRELPQALLSGLYKATENVDTKDLPQIIKQFLKDINTSSSTRCVYETARYLFIHLVQIEKYRDSNKMTLSNLATVFSPNLLENPLETGEITSVDELHHLSIRQTNILHTALEMTKAGILFT
ncbi:DgyrCDS9345 [Dimorphilus gyrociliatus]|uniref:DgyrCDS9345 n=1 Tax=Dimorphilus gyrociliatus TaxID=2664684 RepID=A0A7I8VY12_9ANNE|nr:DgyrCDS9345 [Dimorphilus gyrociliatus]